MDAKELGLPAAGNRTDRTQPPNLGPDESSPRRRTAGHGRPVNGPPHRPSPVGPLRLPRSRARCREPPPRAKPPEREQERRDRRLERADPWRYLATEAELEVLHAGKLVALGQTPHVVAANAELFHLHQRVPLEQIERPLLAVRATPSAEELPRAIADADDEQRADVLAVHSRHAEMQGIPERLDKRREVQIGRASCRERV